MDWPQRGAWGIAFTVTIGAILNAAWLISAGIILLYVSVGLLVFAFDLVYAHKGYISSIKSWRRQWTPVTISLAVIFVSILLFRCSSWVATNFFNVHDDYHAYLVFPYKMLGMGSLGLDPFSERRMTSSLGGWYFLESFILSVLPRKNANIMDMCVGLIFFCGLLRSTFKVKKIPAAAGFLLLIFYLVLPPPKINITALIIPGALFLSLFYALDTGILTPERPIRNAVLVSLLVSAICSLKSNNLPACVILLFLSYLLYFFNVRKKFIVIEFLAVAVLTVIFLAPWMYQMKQSCGTYLYPLLGKGYHVSAYGVFHSPWGALRMADLPGKVWNFLLNNYVLSIVVLGFCFGLARVWPTKGRGALLTFTAAGLISGLSIDIATGGYNSRFLYSFTLPILILMLIHAAAFLSEAKTAGLRAKIMICCVSAFVCVLLFVTEYDAIKKELFRRGISNISQCAMTEKQMDTLFDMVQYWQLQYSVPEGAPVLERLHKPFLLDFKRNPIYIADYPGIASLPPGMPLFGGPDLLAGYIRAKGIRYVAYSYKNQALFPKEVFGPRRVNTKDVWAKEEMILTLRFQGYLSDFGRMYEKVFDDGEVFMVDLASPKSK